VIAVIAIVPMLDSDLFDLTPPTALPPEPSQARGAWRRRPLTGGAVSSRAHARAMWMDERRDDDESRVGHGNE
jgi:hypothetical protein